MLQSDCFVSCSWFSFAKQGRLVAIIIALFFVFALTLLAVFVGKVARLSYIDMFRVRMRDPCYGFGRAPKSRGVGALLAPIVRDFGALAKP
jgi:hypothetical protein